MDVDRLRYLPSLVVAVILLVAMLVVDDMQKRSMEDQRRDEATGLLQQVLVSINGDFSRSHRSMRDLALAVGVSFEIGQAAFDALARKTFRPPLRLIRAEMAPGFTTRLVSPLEGNEGRIGRPAIGFLAEGGPGLTDELARGLPPVADLRVIDGETAELDVRFAVREVNGVEIVTRGMVGALVRFDMMPEDLRSGDLESEFDFLFLTRLQAAPMPELPAEWRQEGDMAPIRTDLHYPVGEFLLHIRPVHGWRPSFDEMVASRLRTLGLGVLLFVPVLLANWFAISGKATRSRLAATETKMSALVNNLPGAAFVYSRPAGNDRPGPDDRVTFLNKDSCQDVWGVDAHVAESNALALWDRAIDKERSEAFTRHLVTASREMRPWTHTWQIRTPEGVEKWLTGRGHPVPMGDGVVSWFCMVFDVSEEVAREAELEKQRDLAFKAQKNESIGHLTGGMAHDFNNLLAVIMANLELLAEDETSPEKSKLIGSALDATVRGADLTRNMLAFARRARLAPETLDLNDVLRDANSWMGRTLPDSVIVETSLRSGLWKVSADRGSTESALLNLILNARDAMNGHGRLTLKTENVRIDADSVGEGGEELAPGHYVQLAVTDTGHGIPKDLRDKIFEPFVTTKETGRGTGLGLSMVMGFMRQSGGTVRVESSLEDGTTIALFFPTATDQKTLLKGSTPGRSPREGAGARILLTEDEPGVRDVLTAILERAGHVVTQAHSGDHAFSLFRSDPAFDLLLTDIVMPGTLQGTDLANALREIRAELPVIFMSGYTNEATAHGADLGKEDLRLMKPVHRSELLEAVITVLDGTASDASV